ncbi:MAG: helix-turn-helix domain-containing protein [Armatimonadetes bacterium]|nr:helix-turn-helix domain-containing protein [Armatimonadota bacterium]MDW8027326.1 helix-turn-helix domain-containing protein [Armatimonadota bacterium]
MKNQHAFIPTVPWVGDEVSWDGIAQIIERNILPRLDSVGSSLFMPIPQPIPPKANILAIEGMLSKPWRNPYPLFAYVVSGNSQMIFNGQWLNLTAGWGVFIPANTPYVAHASLGEQVSPCDVLSISVFTFGALVHRCRLTPKAHYKSSHYAVMNPNLWDLCCIWTELLTKTPANRLAGKGLLLAFFSLLVQTNALPFQARLDNLFPSQWRSLPMPLQRALKWLHHAFERPFQLTRLSRYCGVSPPYLCRLFRNYLGTTPVGYLTKLRLTLAKKLLETTDLSLADIAFLVGFRHASYFIRQFRRHFGWSPSQFRVRERKRLRRNIPVAMRQMS